MTLKIGNDVHKWLKEISSKPVQRYIKDHETDGQLEQLVLRNKTILGIPSGLIADQIKARVKAKIKLPEFYEKEDIVYPPSINLEQCSSETTAHFKKEVLMTEVENKNLMVDLTGGFGVDAKFFSSVFKNVISVDPDVELNEIVRWNFSKFAISNFNRSDLTAEAFLSQNKLPVNCFYADPSRRRDNKKVTGFRNCLPDIVSLQEQIHEQSSFLLIKASPLLDLSLALSELKHVRRVIILSVSNECRELLFFCDRDYSSIPVVEAVNVKGSIRQYFSFTQPEEKSANIEFGDIARFLYEPNASILKSGAFKLVGARFQLLKLHNNSHFYTSNQYCEGFPGRIFEVIKSIKSNSREIMAAFPEMKANIISRNYPLNVNEIKKKLKLVEGGEKFLIATSTKESKVLLVANRLQ